MQRELPLKPCFGEPLASERRDKRLPIPQRKTLAAAVRAALHRPEGQKRTSLRAPR